jgi:excalibur calcium-binding domain-containing protein
MNTSTSRWYLLPLALLLCAFAAAYVVSSTVAPTTAQARDRDCSDFSTQKKAQRFFRKHHPGRDPHRLDSDNDRIACEDNPCPCSRRWHRQHGKVADAIWANPQRRGDFYKRCGSQHHDGAGWYHVRAHKVSCPVARHVARRFWNSGGDTHFEGWSCHSHQVGEEVWKAGCTRQRPGRFQVVRFEYGA